MLRERVIKNITKHNTDRKEAVIAQNIITRYLKNLFDFQFHFENKLIPGALTDPNLFKQHLMAEKFLNSKFIG